MSMILVAWGALGLAFIGLGALTWRGLGLGWPAPGSGAPLFWLGWAGAIGLLQLWQLALPIDGLALTSFFALGGAGLAAWLWRSRTELGAALRSAQTPMLALLLIALWLSQRALAGDGNPDHATYYVSTVRWLEQHPLPPGLGNLNYLLALNHAWFLYAALLDHGPFFHRGEHLANGLLALASLWPALVASSGLLLRPSAPRRLSSLFAALMLPSLLEQARCGNTTGLVPDSGMFFFGAALLILLIRYLELGGEALGAREGAPRVFAVLCASGVVMKPSLICAAGPVLVSVAWTWARQGPPPATRRAWELARMAPIAAAWVGPWMLRGILLSGYPLFPAPIGGVPVSWRLPSRQVTEVYRYVKAFARWPGAPTETVLRDWRWIGHWLSQAWLFDWEFLVPVSLSVLASIALAWSRHGAAPGAGPSARRVLAPLLAGLVLWSLTAPDLRFAGALPWGLTALLLALVLGRVPLPEPHRRLILGVVAASLLAGALSGLPPLWTPRDRLEPLRLRVSPNAIFRTRSGLEVEVGERDGCFEALCTPFPPDARLKLRRPGDLGSGFILDDAGR